MLHIERLLKIVVLSLSLPDGQSQREDLFPCLFVANCRMDLFGQPFNLTNNTFHLGLIFFFPATLETETVTREPLLQFFDDITDCLIGVRNHQGEAIE